MLRSYRDWHPWRHFYGTSDDKIELYQRICEMDESELFSRHEQLVSEVERVLIRPSTVKTNRLKINRNHKKFKLL